jgi:uncharacterized protein YjbJ (UPF0337 family)
LQFEAVAKATLTHPQGHATPRKYGSRRISTTTINWDTIKGHGSQLKVEARKQWGTRTDDDREQIAGEHDKLYARL